MHITKTCTLQEYTLHKRYFSLIFGWERMEHTFFKGFPDISYVFLISHDRKMYQLRRRGIRAALCISMHIVLGTDFSNVKYGTQIQTQKQT